MKWFVVLSVLLMSASVAHAGPDAACRIDGIEGALSGLETAIRSSPAYHHAGGHYSKALRDVLGSQVLLNEGCAVWVRDGKKFLVQTGRALPEKAPAGLDRRCRVEEIERHFRKVENLIVESPAYGHSGGHYSKALEALFGAQRQVWEGCRAWSTGRK